MKLGFLRALVFSVLITLVTDAMGQVGFGTNSPVQNAVVEMNSPKRGLLMPRIKLKDIKDRQLIPNPENSLIIYNTENSVLNDEFSVLPGYYYFDSNSNRWLRFIDQVNKWSILGNSDTNPGTDFVGTTDNKSFIIKRNNLYSGILNENQQITSFGANSAKPDATSYRNTAFGFEALRDNISGVDEVIFGAGGLSFLKEGDNNIALGSHSMHNKLSGLYNAAVGKFSLYNDKTSSSNTARGANSLFSNISGTHNVAVGTDALYSNVLGSFNIALGQDALRHNIDGSFNIATGRSAMFNTRSVAANNIANGYQALYSNEYGSLNVVNGNLSAKNIKSGEGNIATGYNSLADLLSGDYNSAFGVNAGNNLKNGNNNIAIGANTGFSAGTSNGNINIANIIFAEGIASNLSTDGKLAILKATPGSDFELKGSLATPIRTLLSGTISESDYTVLVEGNLNLPQPGVQNKGRMYVLINNNKSTHQITGQFKENGQSSSIYNLNSEVGNIGIMVQSTGKEWVILSKY